MVNTYCYKLIQRFRVTGLFAGQYNTKLHGTITGVLFLQIHEVYISFDIIHSTFGRFTFDRGLFDLFT